jgi:hypothetical protein
LQGIDLGRLRESRFSVATVQMLTYCGNWKSKDCNSDLRLQAGIADAQLRSLGLPATNTPRIAQASFGTPEPFFGVLVSSTAEHQAPLPAGANYIQWILDQLSSGGTALAADALPAGYERTLLYQLQRRRG